MIIKNYSNVTPFIGKDWVVDRSIFTNSHSQVFLTSSNILAAYGHNSHFNFSGVLKSAIGEWIERSTITRNFHKNDKLEALNLISGETIQVDSDTVYFIDGSSFNDSCGLASHLNSKDVIEASYMEFFERHSLIYNWLTKSNGIQIDCTHVKNERINNIMNKVHHFIDELYLFNISLHNSIYVVFALGFGEKYKSLGLKASLKAEDAIYGAIEELQQTFANHWTKNNVNNYEQYGQDKQADMYLKYYESLSPLEMKDEFSYLWEGMTDCCSFEEFIQKESIQSLPKVMKQVADDLNLIPYSAFVPCLYDGFKTKIIKILSPNGYPHMYPVLFNERQTKLCFNKGTSEFPNAYRQIPFP
ncbi:YcaO-like family protein [Paenibacillus sp. 481]|uniref:YcaO-like family protein n=1 Tax=Paenibacillus sp. 481 TaxID=2835869 RepID=UPI001E294D66|nr:YcaO-like family protein [Paenibacillus sp. 481]UHA74284.1 YcaO-like family protein [Paenibacillus sp. 481]